MTDVRATGKGLPERYQETCDTTGVTLAAETELPVEALSQHELGDSNPRIPMVDRGLQTATPIARQRKRGVGADGLVGCGELAKCRTDMVARPLAERTDRGAANRRRFLGVQRHIEENVVIIGSQDTQKVDQSRPLSSARDAS